MTLCLYVLYIENLDENILQDILSLLPKNIQKKISKLRFSFHRHQKTLSYYLLYHTLANELCKNIQDLVIKTDENGKPFLTNYNRQFNLSYSKDIITLTTDETPVGIDVEYITPLDDINKLLDFFSEEERHDILKKNKHKRIEYFYELWTLKESYVKALGKGLSCPLNAFSFKIYKNKIILSKAINSETDWNFRKYGFYQKYKCSICAKHDTFPKDPIYVDVKKLLNLK